MVPLRINMTRGARNEARPGELRVEQEPAAVAHRGGGRVVAADGDLADDGVVGWIDDRDAVREPVQGVQGLARLEGEAARATLVARGGREPGRRGRKVHAREDGA